jgi:hypothetical protein
MGIIMERDSTGTNMDQAIKVLRGLPPREQLKVIAKILPELEKRLSESPEKLRISLLGFSADLGKAPSAEEIDETRKEIFV